MNTYEMRIKVLTGAGAVIAALGIYLYVGNADQNKSADSVKPVSSVAANQAQDIKQMVNDYSTRILKSGSASITSTQLLVNSGTADEVAYALPDSEFFLSVAPYVEKTHPCATHSLTGCQGEMANEEFGVYIEDADGREVMNGAVKSQPNGFIDLWLPRNQKYQITITHDGKQAKTEISTFEQDDTCLTTMQLG
jgi:hypothetical protein